MPPVRRTRAGNPLGPVGDFPERGLERRPLPQDTPSAFAALSTSVCLTQMIAP